MNRHVEDLEFVSRKVTDGVARIKLGLAEQLKLGNLEGRRDWGFARDFVEAMWLMLQQDRPDDYVIATGQSHRVYDLVATAFGYVGLPLERYVVVDPKLFRAAEVDTLVGDASKAKAKLGWTPTVSFDEMIGMMVEADLKRLSQAPDRTLAADSEWVFPGAPRAGEEVLRMSPPPIGTGQAR